MEIQITPTINSVEVAYSLGSSEQRLQVVAPPSVAAAASRDQVVRVVAHGTLRYSVSCPWPEAFPLGEASADALPPIAVRLFCAGGPAPPGKNAVAADSSGSEDSEDPRSSQGGPGPQSGWRGELQLTEAEPRGAFHLLEPGQLLAVAILAPRGGGEGCAGASERESLRVGSIVQVKGGLLGRVAGSPRASRSRTGFFPLRASTEEVMPVEIFFQREAGFQDAPLTSLCTVSEDRDAVVVFNCRAPLGPEMLPLKLRRNMVLPWQALGPWLIGLKGNYAYTVSLEQDFVVALLEHGLFVLPGDDQLFSCPWPVRPFLFWLQEPRRAGQAPGASWGRCKMLRRYGREFELSCNRDLAAHLKRCSDYHADRSWMSDRFNRLMVNIHEDQSNPIRVYAFELWDKCTKQLAAASFGLAIGSFFHDFSMCCLLKDKRSAGAILSKAIGALLTECGVQVWYWGCKSPYMAEYEAHGAVEVPREDYYQRLRSAVSHQLRRDPADVIAAGEALIQPLILGASCGVAA